MHRSPRVLQHRVPDLDLPVQLRVVGNRNPILQNTHPHDPNPTHTGNFVMVVATITARPCETATFIRDHTVCNTCLWTVWGGYHDTHMDWLTHKQDSPGTVRTELNPDT